MSGRNGVARFLARIRVGSLGVGMLTITGSTLWALLDRQSDVPVVAMTWLLPAGLALLMLAFVATALAPAARAEPLPLGSPVSGQWVAVNSPTDKVPSHGTHGFGQSYAVDLLLAPEGSAEGSDEGGREEPTTAARGAFRAPEEYPSFGQPVRAPADAEVVRVVSRMRDHRSRVGQLGLVYFSIEAALRELRGASGLLGNHVVLRLGDGTHFVLAHLQRGSVSVRPGERVAAGQVLAACGNSGNSTEPHLHCQRQDIARPALAVGLPWTIRPGGIPKAGDRTG